MKRLVTLLAAAAVGLQLIQRHEGVRHAMLLGLSMSVLSASFVWLVKDSESLYDYYRLKGGDLARRLPPPQSKEYASALQEVITTYQLANAQRPEKPARRAKVSRTRQAKPTISRHHVGAMATQSVSV